VIAFNDAKRERVAVYLKTEAAEYVDALEQSSRLIDGFESPLGLEALATVDWLLAREGCAAELTTVKKALAKWPGGKDAGERKLRIFDDQLLDLALDRLATA